MNILKQTLTQGAFWQINKMLLRKLGINPALLLTDLIDKYYYFKDRNQLNKEGFFYCTAKDLEESTTLTYHLQKKAIDYLIESGLIETQLKGVPAKVHFKIIEKSVFDLLNRSCENGQNLITSKTTIKEHLNVDIKDFESNNNIDNNKEIIINSLSLSEKPNFISPPENQKKKEEKCGRLPNTTNELNYAAFSDVVRNAIKIDSIDKRNQYITNLGVKPSNTEAANILEAIVKNYIAIRFKNVCEFPYLNTDERAQDWAVKRCTFADFNAYTLSQISIQQAQSMNGANRKPVNQKEQITEDKNKRLLELLKKNGKL